MAYASSEAEYDLLHDQFQQDVPKEVVHYFRLMAHLGNTEMMSSFISYHM